MSKIHVPSLPRSLAARTTATGAQEAAGRRDKTIYCQFRADRGRRTLRGIDEQVAKAEKAIAGLVPVKRNRFITLAEGQNSVNRALEAKARALAGLKGYTTNLAACPDGTPVTADFVISSYHDLWRIEIPCALKTARRRQISAPGRCGRTCVSAGAIRSLPACTGGARSECRRRRRR